MFSYAWKSSRSGLAYLAKRLGSGVTGPEGAPTNTSWAGEIIVARKRAKLQAMADQNWRRMLLESKNSGALIAVSLLV